MRGFKLFLFLAIFTSLISSTVKTTEGDAISDITHFLGERIRLTQPQSAKIRKLRFDLHLPAGYKLLAKAGSSLGIFTSDGKFSRKFPVKEVSGIIPIHREISADTLYMELALYYCKQGKEGLCLIKKVLFDVPLQKSNQSEDIHLDYTVPEGPK